jgi:transposase, IS5 family
MAAGRVRTQAIAILRTVANCGRRGLTAAQVLLALVLMRVKDWDYRELRERIADGITLRAFTNFYCGPSMTPSTAASTG